MKLPHWAQIVLGISGAVIVWVMNAEASGQLVLPATIASAILLLKTIIGILSPGAVGPMASRLRRMIRIAGPAMLLFFVACTQVRSMLESVSNVIIADWQEGKSDEQILVDVGTALGGKTGADVAKVVDDVVSALIDSGELARVHPELVPRASTTHVFAKERAAQ